MSNAIVKFRSTPYTASEKAEIIALLPVEGRELSTNRGKRENAPKYFGEALTKATALAESEGLSLLPVNYTPFGVRVFRDLLPGVTLAVVGFRTSEYPTEA